MRPADLIPGDTLCYKSHDILGSLISWGEWTTGHENTSYVHIAGVFDNKRLIRQNPGGPAFEDLDAQPWEFIDVWRLKEQPSDMVAFQKALEGARVYHWSEGYAYSEFGDYVFSDLEARVGAMTDADARRKAANWMVSNHASVCSVFWGQEVLQDALAIVRANSDFRMFPALGPGQARPADYPMSPRLFQVGS